MSTDRDDMNDRDEVVSAAYRELAGETTPAHLDARVLRQAQEHAAATYRGRVRWTQPVAWAAMIVVTLAILLQVSELPEPPPPGLAVPAEPAAQDAAAEFKVEGAAEPAPAAAPPARQEPAAPAAGERAEADAPAARRSDDSFGDIDASMIREAEERAREQSGSTSPPETSLRSAVTATAFEAQRAEPACDDEARGAPERWLECIEALREAGELATAERELAELRAAHPELELP